MAADFIPVFPTAHEAAQVDDDGTVYLAYAAAETCSHCGQHLTTGWTVGTWLGRFGPQGHHDFQHGCGTWNMPCEVVVRVRDGESVADAITRAESLVRAELAGRS